MLKKQIEEYHQKEAKRREEEKIILAKFREQQKEASVFPSTDDTIERRRFKEYKDPKRTTEEKKSYDRS